MHAFLTKAWCNGKLKMHSVTHPPHIVVDVAVRRSPYSRIFCLLVVVVVVGPRMSCVACSTYSKKTMAGTGKTLMFFPRAGGALFWKSVMCVFACVAVWKSTNMRAMLHFLSEVIGLYHRHHHLMRKVEYTESTDLGNRGTRMEHTA